MCRSPDLLPDSISLAHPKQGLLGDCWFICACSFLLQKKHLLNKVGGQIFRLYLVVNKLVISSWVLHCQTDWLFVGAVSRPASVGWQQVQRLLPLSFLAAGTLDRGDHWRPPSLHQFLPLFLTVPFSHYFLGGPVRKGLRQVSQPWNFNFLSLCLIFPELWWKRDFSVFTLEKYLVMLSKQHVKGSSEFHLKPIPSSSGFMVHMRDCGQDKCPRPWWIWPGAWPSAGAWETVGQRLSRDQKRTLPRSRGEHWT